MFTEPYVGYDNAIKHTMRIQYNDLIAAYCDHITPKPVTIKQVIFNDPATIVFWTDGSKTVVKKGDSEQFDPEKGLAMAISKKFLGNKGNYYNTFEKWLPKPEDKKESKPIGKVINRDVTAQELEFTIEMTDEGKAFLKNMANPDRDFEFGFKGVSITPEVDKAVQDCSNCKYSGYVSYAEPKDNYNPTQRAYDILVSLRDDETYDKTLDLQDKLDELIGYLGEALE